MQAMVVRRVDGPADNARYYLDGKLVSREAYNTAHFGRKTDSYSARSITRKRDGAEFVRLYHCIRVNQS